MSALRILAPVLTTENAVEVLAGIRGKTTREVEDFRNAFRPVDKPAARGVVRTICPSTELRLAGCQLQRRLQHQLQRQLQHQLRRRLLR